MFSVNNHLCWVYFLIDLGSIMLVHSLVEVQETTQELEACVRIWQRYGYLQSSSCGRHCLSGWARPSWNHWSTRVSRAQLASEWCFQVYSRSSQWVSAESVQMRNASQACINHAYLHKAEADQLTEVEVQCQAFSFSHAASSLKNLLSHPAGSMPAVWQPAGRDMVM